MPLEADIQALTAAVQALTAKLTNGTFSNLPTAVFSTSAAPPAAVVPIAPVAPAMPPPPTFLTPTAPPAPAAIVAPFSDIVGLSNYAGAAYTEIAKAKGQDRAMQINNVMASLGAQNITDMKLEQYGAFYAGVEALKA